MSLTSYRAAPPRGGLSLFVPVEKGREGRGDCGPGGDLLFRTLGCSTIGAEGFHGRVRDGIGCLAPRYGHQAGKACPGTPAIAGGCPGVCHVRKEVSGEAAPALTGTGLRVLPLHAGGGEQAPIERLVPVGSTGCPAFTSGLSTWWSSTALGETWF